MKQLRLTTEPLRSPFFKHRDERGSVLLCRAVLMLLGFLGNLVFLDTTGGLSGIHRSSVLPPSPSSSAHSPAMPQRSVILSKDRSVKDHTPQLHHT